LDADARHNLHVALPLAKHQESLSKVGVEVVLEVWDEKDGKGIDDLLGNGKQPDLVTGEDVGPAIEEIVKSARTAGQRSAKRKRDGQVKRSSASTHADGKPPETTPAETDAPDGAAPTAEGGDQSENGENADCRPVVFITH